MNIPQEKQVRLRVPSKWRNESKAIGGILIQILIKIFKIINMYKFWINIEEMHIHIYVFFHSFFWGSSWVQVL